MPTLRRKKQRSIVINQSITKEQFRKLNELRIAKGMLFVQDVIRVAIAELLTTNGL